MTAKMDDQGVLVNMDSTCTTLQEQVERLVSLRLPGTHALCTKSLIKRRRKWRERHRTSDIKPCGDDKAQLEIERLFSSVYEVGIKLAAVRREGLDTVSQLRAEKWEHCLLAINYRLCHSKLSLESLQQTQPPHVPSDMAQNDLDQHATIQGLQMVLNKARSLKTIEAMKFTETPRVPTIAQPSTVDMLTPLPPLSQDPSSLQLDISLPQAMETTLDCNNNISAMVSTEVSTTLPLESSVPISMPISFMPANPLMTPVGDFTRTSDTDTSPTVGMEVVCGGGEFAVDNDMVVGSSHLVALTPLPTETPNSENIPEPKKPCPSVSSKKQTRIHRKKGVTPPQRHSKRLSKSPFSSTVKAESPQQQSPQQQSPQQQSPQQQLPLPMEVADRVEDVAVKYPLVTPQQSQRKKKQTKSPHPSTSKKGTPRERKTKKRKSKSPKTKNGLKAGRLSSGPDDDSDSDSKMRKMLAVLERAPYNLRIPQTSQIGENTRIYFQNGVSVTEDIRKRRRSGSSFDF